MNGKISIARTQSNKRDDYISIYIEDPISGVQFFSGEMSLADFAHCITGRSDLPVEFELSRPDLVGMKSENKTELVKFKGYSSVPSKERDGLESNDRSHSVDKALAPFEVDGWRGHVSDLFNGHRSVGDKQRVTFFRHVDPKTGKPIIK